MRIVFFEAEELETKTLLDLYGDIDYDTVNEPVNASNAEQYAEAEIISTFLYSDLSREVLEKMKRLKLIATRSRSYDHIDIGFCEQAGITVVNVPFYGQHTVAEHVFALLLSLSRHIPQAAQRVREGDFSLEGLQGFDLYGKTMGIIGTGAIGLHTAKIAAAFNMNVMGYDIRPQYEAAEKAGLAYAGLDTLLAGSDIISVHVTDTPETCHILSGDEFNKMKDGVVIINTAGGSAIDIKALLEALTSGKVSAAGLDVLPDESGIREEAEFLRGRFFVKHNAETLLASHSLLRHKNVIVTPHAASYTKETMVEIIRATGDSIRNFQAGKPVHAVNQPKISGDKDLPKMA